MTKKTKLYKKKIKNMYNYDLLWSLISLYVIGLIMVFSTSINIGKNLYNNYFFFLERHFLYICIALSLSLIFLRIPMIFWDYHSKKILILSIILLFIVSILGNSVNGSSRWVNIGFINFQPSEISKISLFCYLSSYLKKNIKTINKTPWNFYKPIFILIILSYLIISQPDLGTVIILLTTTLVLLFLAGFKLKNFILMIVLCIITIVPTIIYTPYRIKRIISFIDPWKDPFGNGYQIIQSFIAFGRGHIFGVGLGNSIQKLEYLPESNTDFIYSIIAEELGYVGTLFVLSIIIKIAINAMYIGKIALKNQEIFSGFLAISISIWLYVQTIINIGVVTGILPTKGLTLPLISYGGSSLIITSIAIFWLLRIDFENKIKNYFI
ncbi:Probable peptidoglycan glycosyltransferase FtsW [Buchnera aphidicola (Neophyllaphis podocarpi)]|uniref:putative lipid II flippase FtsW n=1 Tax=Buchnera aphidicola TaxID=9 RepID=UPI0031B8748B